MVDGRLWMLMDRNEHKKSVRGELEESIDVNTHVCVCACIHTHTTHTHHTQTYCS